MDARQQTQLAKLCRKLYWNVDMSAYSTFRTGGTVEALVESADPDELAQLVSWLNTEQVPWRIIGGGSNILVRDGHHQGVFIRLRNVASEDIRLVAKEIDAKGSCRVEVWAGAPLASLVSWCTRKNLAGFEYLAGIPGTVGGALQMNAGAFGQTISDFLYSIQVLDSEGKIREYDREKMTFRYRQILLAGKSWKNVIFLRAFFNLPFMDGALLAECNREALEQRRQHQPQGYASAGSFFKNPEGDFAGRLIEQAGLKGLRQGDAMVSPKHGNFIVNIGGAKSGDIIILMRRIQEKVLQKTGILLEPEVCIF